MLFPSTPKMLYTLHGQPSQPFGYPEVMHDKQSCPQTRLQNTLKVFLWNVNLRRGSPDWDMLVMTAGRDGQVDSMTWERVGVVVVGLLGLGEGGV